MNKPKTSWVKRVGGKFVCPFCEGISIKYGKSAAQKQRYYWKNCSRTYIDHYTKQAYSFESKPEINKLLKECMSIRSISRYLNIAKNTVVSGILKLANSVRKPSVIFGMSYELDEQHTYIQNKETGVIWITYALCRETKEVVDFVVGNRTNIDMQKVVNTVLLSNPKKVYTDGLANWHRKSQYGIVLGV